MFGLLIDFSLAMAEMTTLVAAVYRKYTTTTHGDFDSISPAITARYEVFYDETCRGTRVGLLAPNLCTELTNHKQRSMNATLISFKP